MLLYCNFGINSFPPLFLFLPPEGALFPDERRRGGRAPIRQRIIICWRNKHNKENN